ncbi:FtsH protease activity modulator HflK [Piscinibacter koreensis]|uniref:Protein HflK n=1 Tax=Piscinibacter koreensis TaxID=2742824 RepID=A0A7Y6TWJ9_9BURK|nr:FtsH protease activity modulator HflK [Schlegelella koreensis]NUZ06199.1 FtsH protease activity modulator HflK [Schlegelella koreensis]
MSIRLPEPGPDGLAARVLALVIAGLALLGGIGRAAWQRVTAAPTTSPAGADRLLATGGRGDGPPDLDELWRDFNRKLSGLFGNKGGGGNRNNTPEPGNQRPSFQPNMRNAGVGAGLIAGILILIWLGSGFFIVQEGQQAVVTSFGQYKHTVDAGFQWRLPYPFQAHETVNVTQLRSKEVGRNVVVQATGLRDSSMLTQDENIVDIRFTVQYRLNDARAFLFENRDPEEAVTLAAESAVREIVAKANIDSVLYEQRDAIAADLVKSIQGQLDRLRAGILIVNVNLQSVQPPEQVQAAFEDTLKAGQDADRAKKEGLAYASDVIPKAQGSAARLREEAEAYRARVIAQAEGDAQRFNQVLAEYQKAPGVTRDRLYIETMQQIYSNVAKVMVETRNNSNLLYLPLDKLLQQNAAAAPNVAPPAATAPPMETPVSAGGVDIRSRDAQRGRERETR